MLLWANVGTFSWCRLDIARPLLGAERVVCTKMPWLSPWHFPDSQVTSLWRCPLPAQVPQFLPFFWQKWRWNQPGKEKKSERRGTPCLLWSRKRGRS